MNFAHDDMPTSRYQSNRRKHGSGGAQVDMMETSYGDVVGTFFVSFVRPDTR
jgi:hypothetical protein